VCGKLRRLGAGPFGGQLRVLGNTIPCLPLADCCDGSDEPKGKCQNTCLQAAAVRKEELRGKIQLHEVMLSTKKEYFKRASSFKEELKLKSHTIDEDIAKQADEVEGLKGAQGVKGVVPATVLMRGGIHVGFRCCIRTIPPHHVAYQPERECACLH
jgi:hypothetical protein